MFPRNGDGVGLVFCYELVLVALGSLFEFGGFGPVETGIILTSTIHSGLLF